MASAERATSISNGVTLESSSINTDEATDLLSRVHPPWGPILATASTVRMAEPATHKARRHDDVHRRRAKSARDAELRNDVDAHEARVGHRVRRRRPQGREESSDDYADADIGDGPQAPDISGQGKGRVGYADHDDALVIDGLTLAPKAGGVDDEHVGYGRGRGRDCRRDPQGGKPLPKSDAEDDQQVRGAEHADRDGACEAGVAPSASGNAGTEHYLGGDAGKGDGDGGRDVGGGRKHRGAKRPRARLARSQSLTPPAMQVPVTDVNTVPTYGPAEQRARGCRWSTDRRSV